MEPTPPSLNPEEPVENLESAAKFSSLQNLENPSEDIDENLPDSDDEVLSISELPPAPEIHEESSRYYGEIKSTAKGHFHPSWKWIGKDLKSSDLNRKIKILCLTWNMFGKAPPVDLNELLPRYSRHHLYAITTQECLRSIGKSLLYSSKKQWEVLVRNHLGEEYTQISAGTIGATHLLVFCHESLLHLITGLETRTIATGVGNIIGNKGAVAASFSLGGSSLLFVGCHLAAGQGSVVQRNNNFQRIEREACKDGQGFKASDNVDFCFYMGDLNYRINGSKEDVEILITHEMLSTLITGDQLSKELRENTVFSGFVEGQIGFPPTYRFNCGTDSYDTSKKQRIPAWTDRVIYKRKDESLIQKSYGCISSCTRSDHKPVFSQFTLKYNSIPKPITKTEKSRACRIF